MRDPQWHRIFPDQDFRWSMALQPGDAADFFAPSPDWQVQVDLRRVLLAEAPEHYAVLPDSAAGDIAEAVALLSRCAGRPFADAWQAGAELEPDWVILKPDETGRCRVIAGVVCFPSQWSLPEKAGLSIEAVHGPVPALNDALSRQIDSFLARLTEGTVWERENWGLSADDALDHHPRHGRQRLTGAEPLDAVWLRRERQIFLRLPGGGLIFGIRIGTHRLDELTAGVPGLARRLARALRTMPDDAAVYKNLVVARPALVERLEAAG